MKEKKRKQCEKWSSVSGVLVCLFVFLSVCL